MSTIVLAEDHAIIRQGLKDLLQSEADFQIVGEATNGLQAVERVSEFQPDALVTDLMMPQLNGLEVISHIRLAFPKTRIVVVTAQVDKPYVLEAFRRGANGFVQKEFSAVHLVDALRRVLAGGRYLSPTRSLSWLAEIPPEDAGGTLDLFETLTEQQRHLMQMVAGGQSDWEIAGRLRLKQVTVGHIRAALMKKFNLQSPAELGHFAEARGLRPEYGGV
jgi:two-component system, NarL family, response regulator NreC